MCIYVCVFIYTLYRYTDTRRETLRSDICNKYRCYNNLRFLRFNDPVRGSGSGVTRRHQMYLSLFYVEIKMLDSENYIKIMSPVVKRNRKTYEKKKIMFLNSLQFSYRKFYMYTIISRLIYVYSTELVNAKH